MYQDKPWYKSKTIWGGIVALLAGIAGIFGYGISTPDQVTLTEGFLAVGSAVGGVIAVYGRIVAKENVKLKPG
jgi:hypothetical protein